MAEQKAEQLERARQERIAAAAKLKALKEGTQPATAAGKDMPAKPSKEETDAKDTKVQLKKISDSFSCSSEKKLDSSLLYITLYSIVPSSIHLFTNSLIFCVICVNGNICWDS